MTSPDDSVSIRSQPTRASRPLRSRWGAFLAPKNNQVTSFEIKLEDPHKHYGPGDIVKGHVAVTVAKPIGITHICICLQGSVDVFKNPNKPKPRSHGLNQHVANRRGKRWVTQYYGDGYASLFEEELVLCGEGRVDPGIWIFQFETQFPSDLSLPSSIKFERGNISYQVVATLTRTNTLSPCITDDCEVKFREVVDVAKLPPPQGQMAILNPEVKPSKKRGSLRRLTSTTSSKGDSTKPLNSSRTFTANSVTSNEDAVSDRPPSPSVASTMSASSAGAKKSNAPSEPRSSITNSIGMGNLDSVINKTVKATAKPSQAGCLPGDTLQINIHIEHHKAIRSTHGIIVTLYRTAYVDSHPHIPIGPADSDAEPKYEDYYPRSRTGLGGLSLSNAGSSQTWRKDLYQTFKPLIIDPVTRTANIKVNVQVPENALPTIVNAPGNMISFTYALEIIMDIHGKLASQTGLPRFGLVESDASTSNGNVVQTGFGGEPAQTNYGSNCIDTMPLRRGNQQLVLMTCPLVVGTKNSAKTLRKGKQVQKQVDATVSAEDFASLNGHDASTQYRDHFPGWYDAYGYWHPAHMEEYEYDEYGYGYGYGYDQHAHPHEGFYPGPHQPDHDFQTHWPHHPPPSSNGHAYAVPPSIEPMEGLSEKERMQRFEQSLVPSEPPPIGDAAGGRQEADAPSAPTLVESDEHGIDSDVRTVANGRTTPTPSSSVRGTEALPPTDGAAPSYHETTCSSTNSVVNGTSAAHDPDDKQELERRRLQVEASEPPATDGAAGPSAPPASALEDNTPSAPILSEEEELSVLRLSAPPAGYQEGLIHGESLPRYER